MEFPEIYNTEETLNMGSSDGPFYQPAPSHGIEALPWGSSLKIVGSQLPLFWLLHKERFLTQAQETRDYRGTSPAKGPVAKADGSLRQKHITLLPDSSKELAQRFCKGGKAGQKSGNFESLPKGTDFICNRVEGSSSLRMLSKMILS